MTPRSRLALTCAALLGSVACDPGPEPDVVAVAEEHRFTVDEAASLLASQDQLPNQPEIVVALADLWIDYTLLAIAAHEDSLLESIDLTPLVRAEVEQELVYRLRDEVIQVDTVVSEEELQALWAGAGPDGEITARHILLGIPDGATEEQRDSVRALAAELKERATAGESFVELAQQYSQDRGSASLGGDLGTFGRGDMVGPFEAAAFALEEGEISDPVETIYGYHVIRVDEKDVERLEDEETRLAFLAEVRAARFAAAESVYVASIEEPADVRVEEGAIGAVREIARRPGQRLSRRAARRALTRFDGGAFTAQDFQEFIQSRPPAFRTQVPSADSSALEELLMNLTRGKLLVRAARERGLQLDDAERDSLLTAARSRFVVAATQLGLVDIQPTEGETVSEAISRRVTENLGEILQGQRDVIPLGIISYTLRQQYRGQLYESTVSEVVRQVGEMQTGQSARPRAAPSEQRAPNAPPPPDSAGEGPSP